MNDPLISVVLPTHNRCTLLRRSVASVLGQSWRNLELIVVDDGSSDGTRRYLDSLDDPRLRVVRRSRSTGVGAARNTGLAVARGKWVAFQDDDDIWLAEKLERQAGHLADQAARTALSICGHIVLLPGRRARLVCGPQAFGRMNFLNGFSLNFALIATPGWLARREAIEAEGGFDERMRCWDDWELGLRLSQRWGLAHLPDPLFLQDRTRGISGAWNNRLNFANDIDVIQERHGRIWADRPDVLARHHRIRGRSLVLRGESREGRRWLWRAVAIRPHDPRTWVNALLSLLGTTGYRLGLETMEWLRAPRRRTSRA